MEITAYHEAGHVFMAIYLGARVRSVTIEPDRDDGPDRFGDAQVEWDLAHFTRREVCEKSVLVALAGPVAARFGRRNRVGRRRETTEEPRAIGRCVPRSGRVPERGRARLTGRLVLILDVGPLMGSLVGQTS
jgi:hypothetical protein